MSVSPRLPRHLRAAIGADAGEELVTILDELRTEHARQMARLDEHFIKVDTRLDRIDDRLVSLQAKISDVKSDLMKWSFVFWCGAVASIAALAGALR